MPLPLVAIAAAVSAAASVGGAVKGGIDADKKRNIEQQLTFLNNDQKLKLEKHSCMILKILTDTLKIEEGELIKNVIADVLCKNEEASNIMSQSFSDKVSDKGLYKIE